MNGTVVAAFAAGLIAGPLLIVLVLAIVARGAQRAQRDCDRDASGGHRDVEHEIGIGA